MSFGDGYWTKIESDSKRKGKGNKTGADEVSQSNSTFFFGDSGYSGKQFGKRCADGNKSKADYFFGD